MSNQIIDNEIDGYKKIELITRPPRVVFLLSKNEDIEKFITISSHSIGGRYFLPVPVDQDNEICDDWKKIISTYNPDQIFPFSNDFVDIANDINNLRFDFLDRTKKNNNREISDDHSRYYIGQPIINFFLLEKLNNEEKNLKLSFIPEECDFDIYHKAYYGVLDDNKLFSFQASIGLKEWKEKEKYFERYKFNSKHSLLADIKLHQKERKEFISIIDYTQRYIQYTYSTNLFSNHQKSESNKIIVLSKEPNIKDFCCFWALRAQRVNTWDPYSITPIWLSSEDFFDNHEFLPKFKKQYIISTSLEANEIPFDLCENYEFINNNISDFYKTYFHIGNLEETFVFIKNFEFEYKSSGSDIVKYIQPNQFALFDINIPGVTLPKIQDTIWFSKNRQIQILSNNVTKNGFTEYIHSYKPDFVKKCVIPESFLTLETIAYLSGYQVSFSDKGKIAESIISKLGGYENLVIFSNESFRNFLLSMSGVHESKELKKIIQEQGYQSIELMTLLNRINQKTTVENPVDYSNIRKKFPKSLWESEILKSMIEWLLMKGLLIQGRTIKCPNCYDKNWVSIDDFQSIIFCRGCSHKIVVPFGINSLTFQYQINSLLKQSIEQGVIPHLLLSYFFYLHTNTIIYKSNIHFLYNGIIFSKDDEENKKFEIDNVLLVDGRLVIAECKVSKKDFTEDEIKKILFAAKEIQAKEVYFVYLENYDVELESKIRDHNNYNINIKILSKEQLDILYPGYYYDEEKNSQLRKERQIRYLGWFFAQ